MADLQSETSRETAPFPRTFGKQAQRVAALIRVAPSLAARLALAPARALHSVAAYLEAKAARGASLESMADALSSCAPRALLGQALPNHDARLFRLLNRAALPAWSLAEVMALDDVLRAELGDILSDGPISPETVSAARLILDAHPIVQRVCRAIPDSWTRAKLSTAITWLDEQGALAHLSATPRVAGLSAIARRLRRDLATLRAPQAPFSIPADWAQIDTVDGLWAVGRELENCLAFAHYGACERVPDLLTGRDVYLFSRALRVVFRLRHMGGRTWACVERGGHRNKSLKPEVIRGLADALRACGVVYLDDDLGTALEHLIRPLRARPDLADAEDAEDADVGDDGRQVAV
jgi:hypothetical protein